MCRRPRASTPSWLAGSDVSRRPTGASVLADHAEDGSLYAVACQREDNGRRTTEGSRHAGGGGPELHLRMVRDGHRARTLRRLLRRHAMLVWLPHRSAADPSWHGCRFDRTLWTGARSGVSPAKPTSAARPEVGVGAGGGRPLCFEGSRRQTPRVRVGRLTPVVWPADVPPPSSSDPGRRPFKAVARVRIPLGARTARQFEGMTADGTAREATQQGPVVKPGVHAALSRRRSRVRIPSGPRAQPLSGAPGAGSSGGCSYRLSYLPPA